LVGLTNGAIGQSRVTTVVSFDVPSTVATPTPTPTPGPCVGDCNNDGQVTVDEILTLVNIALGTAEPSACVDGIPSGSQVDITLILQAVNHALDGCGGHSEIASERVGKSGDSVLLKGSLTGPASRHAFFPGLGRPFGADFSQG
jgi:hypothetical protein